jgi:hypothetical protein
MINGKGVDRIILALSLNDPGGLRKTAESLSIIHISVEIRAEYIITVTWYIDMSR